MFMLQIQGGLHPARRDWWSMQTQQACTRCRGRAQEPLAIVVSQDTHSMFGKKHLLFNFDHEAKRTFPNWDSKLGSGDESTES